MIARGRGPSYGLTSGQRGRAGLLVLAALTTGMYMVVTLILDLVDAVVASDGQSADE